MISFDGVELVIKLNFTNPSHISKRIVPDILVFEINQLDYFGVPNSGTRIEFENYVIRKPLQKQLEDNYSN